MPRRIGLLGGSFNPAHSGHLHVAMTAMRRLRLTETWFIVARGNPLKSEHGEFNARLASATALTASNPRLKVSNIEARLGLTYSVDTSRELIRRHSDAHFVWLMGSDNLASFHLWKDWQLLAQSLPLAIIARPGYRPGGSIFEHRFKQARLPERAAPLLPSSPAPAWVYLKAPFNPQSSTAIRTGIHAKN